jgi:hypothetical protein
MGCGCKDKRPPVILNPKPVEIPIEEIDHFNNIDIIEPINNEEESTGTTNNE